MITSQEGLPGLVTLGLPSTESREDPRPLTPALLGLPLLPQLDCTLPHPCLLIPCASYGEMPHRRPLGCCGSALLKSPCPPIPSLHAVGAGSAVACVDS